MRRELMGAILIFFLLGGIAESQRAEELPANCSLSGRLVVKFPDGREIPAHAKVYVLYTEQFVWDGYRDNQFFSRTDFDHRLNTYTAGGQYLNRYVPMFENDKVLNRKRRGPISDELALDIAERTINYIDDALATSLKWVATSRRDGWQVTVTTPDDQGNWTVNGLHPGGYYVIAQGTVSQLEVVWIQFKELAPGVTHSFPEARPDYFRPHWTLRTRPTEHLR